MPAMPSWIPWIPRERVLLIMSRPPMTTDWLIYSQIWSNFNQRANIQESCQDFRQLISRSAIQPRQNTQAWCPEVRCQIVKGVLLTAHDFLFGMIGYPACHEQTIGPDGLRGEHGVVDTA